MKASRRASARVESPKWTICWVPFPADSAVIQAICRDEMISVPFMAGATIDVDGRHIDGEFSAAEMLLGILAHDTRLAVRFGGGLLDREWLALLGEIAVEAGVYSVDRFVWAGVQYATDHYSQEAAKYVRQRASAILNANDLYEHYGNRVRRR